MYTDVQLLRLKRSLTSYFVLIKRRQTRSDRTDTLFPYTTRSRPIVGQRYRLMAPTVYAARDGGKRRSRDAPVRARSGGAAALGEPDAAQHEGQRQAVVQLEAFAQQHHAEGGREDRHQIDEQIGRAHV